MPGTNDQVSLPEVQQSWQEIALPDCVHPREAACVEAQGSGWRSFRAQASSFADRTPGINSQRHMSADMWRDFLGRASTETPCTCEVGN